MKGKIEKWFDSYIIEFSRKEKKEGLLRYEIIPEQVEFLASQDESIIFNYEFDFEIINHPTGDIQYAKWIPTNCSHTLTKTNAYKRTNSEKIQNITDSLNRLLQAKNKNYGNSALEPLGIFNKNEATEGIKVRLDDKLMRVKNSSTLRKNDISDIMGYLVLLWFRKNG